MCKTNDLNIKLILIIISYFIQLWEQLLYFVQETEQWMCKDVMASMMSHEEPIEVGKIARKHPSWWSEGLNNLIDTIDQTANPSIKNADRKEKIHILGIEMATQTNLNEWMKI